MKISNVSIQELDDEVVALQKVYDEQASQLSEEERSDEFDHFYNAVVKVLLNHGSFSDGGLEEADFSSSRYVDPSPVLVVVNTDSISERLTTALMSELKTLPGVHGVVFDSVEQVAVFSEGRVLVAK